MPTPATAAVPPESKRLRDVAFLFLRLGVTAFGGPAAHIALMEDETVTRRKWLSRDDFLDLLGIANLLPGPSSSEMAIYLGFRRAGWPGLILGGVCFVLPAALLTGLIAWVYLRFGSLPQATGMLYAIRPVIVVIVVQALVRLGRTALKTPLLGALAVCAVLLSFFGIGPVWVLLCSGVLAALIQQGRRRRQAMVSFPFYAVPVAAVTQVTLGSLFLVFFKLGSVVFGSGYVLLAFLRADLVAKLHWLTEKQLLDAVAVGQITPGPVFTTATFIGYLLGGPRGATVATVAIFLPAFLLVAITGRWVSSLRKSALASAVLDGVNGASLGLMAAVTLYLARTAFVDVATVLAATASVVLLFRYRIHSAWLILGAAILGVLFGHRS
jgi:chromate transporter